MRAGWLRIHVMEMTKRCFDCNGGKQGQANHGRAGLELPCQEDRGSGCHVVSSVEGADFDYACFDIRWMTSGTVRDRSQRERTVSAFSSTSLIDSNCDSPSIQHISGHAGRCRMSDNWSSSKRCARPSNERPQSIGSTGSC